MLRLLDRMTGTLEGSMETSIDGLHLHRLSQPVGPKPAFQAAALSVIAQGTKLLLVGDEAYEYDPFHYLISSVDLPVVAKVSVASPSRPLPGTAAGPASRGHHRAHQRREPAARAAVRHLARAERESAGRHAAGRAAAAAAPAGHPRDIPFLAPMIKRELLYRLMMDGQGAALRQTVLQDSQLNRVAKAIRILRDNYAQPLRVEDIARDVHMSVSSLHHHFKQATAMSPLQYQKHLRLQEARRIMLADDAGVALARTRSAMKAHRSSAANTAACSARRRCATSSAGGTRRRRRRPERSLAPEAPSRRLGSGSRDSPNS